MNKKLVTPLWGLIALSMSGPSLASDFEPYAYVLASIGQADTSLRPSSVDVIKDDDTSWEIGAGYAFNKTLAIEVSYQDFGEPLGMAGCPLGLACVTLVPFAVENVEVDGWSAVLRGNVPIAERFTAFGKIGLLAWDMSANHPALNDSGTDLLLGIGVATQLSDRVDLQLSYETANVDIDTVKLGIRLGF